MRRADRDVQGGVRVDEGGGADVGPEVSARDEARNLGLSGVITSLCSGVNECGDHVVTAGGLAQGAAGGVGGAHTVQPGTFSELILQARKIEFESCK